MITKTNSLNNINEITLTNLENGEVTLEQLNEIYNKMGFVFVANKGRFTKIRKDQVSAKQIDCIVFYAVSKEIRKDKIQNQ